MLEFHVGAAETFFNILVALACTSRNKSRDFSCLDIFLFLLGGT